MNRSFIAFALFVADGVRAAACSRSTRVPPPGCRPMDGKVRCGACGHRSRHATRFGAVASIETRIGADGSNARSDDRFRAKTTRLDAFAPSGALGKRYGRALRWAATSALRAQDAGDVTLFPGDGALVVPELFFAQAKLRRMNERAPRPSACGNHVVEHLVVDDELYEVAGNPRAIEIRVDAEQ